MTRPNIDEATIAGVVEVLRSGWITSGPKVKVCSRTPSRVTVTSPLPSRFT
jgi:dTDP-4-amino-4,6-dideoxygalactose transaminase